MHACARIPEGPLEIDILVGSYEKAKKVLDWEPKYDLETGLKECVQYWKNFCPLQVEG
jgi:nucleoside-diphosphate-sugar epimerase